MRVATPKHFRSAMLTIVALSMLSFAIACTSEPTGPEADPTGEGVSTTDPVGEGNAADEARAGDDAGSDDEGGQAGSVAGTAGAQAVGDGQSGAVGTATAIVAAKLPVLDTIIGHGGVGPDDIMLPVDIAVADDGGYFLADVTGIRKLDADGAEVMRLGADQILTTQGGLALGPGGQLYVTGFGPQVWVFDADSGELVSTIGEAGSAAGQLSKPVDVAVDSEGDIYVADATNSRIEKYAADGAHLLSIGERGQERGQFTSPRTVAIDSEGLLYVGLGDDYLVQRFTPEGTYVDALGQAHGDENAWRVGGVAVDADGNVYVSQALSGRIQRFSGATDQIEWEFGSPGQGRDSFSSPLGIALDGSRLIVVDQGNSRIKVYTLPTP